VSSIGLTVPLTDFLPEVMQYVPDVPEFVALNSLRNAAIEFCEKTRVIQVDIDPITLQDNKASYIIQTPPDMKFVDLVEAYIGDRLIIPKSSEELARIYRATDWRSLKGSTAYITRVVYPEIQLVPYLETVTDEILRIRASLAPTRDATEVPESLYQEFVEQISYGARGRLYGTPKQSYTDKTMAREYLMMFRSAIGEVKTRVNRGLTRASGSIEFQRVI
jgi:hypothetical protein